MSKRKRGPASRLTPTRLKAKRKYQRWCLKSADYWQIVHLLFDWGTNVGGIQKAIATAVGTTQSTVSKTLKRWENDSNPLPLTLRSHGIYRGRLADTQKAFIYDLVDKDPSIYLDEIQDEWRTRFLQTAPLPSKSTICRVLKAKGLTRIVLEHRAMERDEMLRWVYRHTVRMLPGHHRFVFMDEAHFDNRNVRRRRGCAYGQPAVVMRKLGRQSNTSLLAAVTVKGMLPGACVAYEDGINTDVLCDWAQYRLFPNLPRGTTLVLDNASIHHSDGFMDSLDMAIRYPGCVLVHYEVEDETAAILAGVYVWLKRNGRI